MSGWIKLHRKITENPWIKKDNDYLSVWIQLLINASFKPRKEIFEGVSITLLPGQLITGRKELAKMSNVNESKVERILKRFKSEQQIEQRSSANCRLITIYKWEEYQGDEQESEQRVNNDRTSSEQRVNTHIRMKELKNERKHISSKKNKNEDQKFLTFYSLYPRKIAKQAALTAWQKLSEDQKDSAIAAIPNHLTSDQWQKDGGQFIPHPATWLNQGRWEDDVAASNTYSEYGPKFQSLNVHHKKVILNMAKQYEQNLGIPADLKTINEWIDKKL